MTDEAAVCAATFFRIRGKDVVTPKEFAMTVSLDLKWMPVKEAAALMDLLLEKGAITRSNGYLRPSESLKELQVPIAYRPSEALRQELAGRSKTAAAKPTAPAAAKPAGDDLFPVLVKQAVSAGLAKGAFISECNSVKKTLGTDICAAALLVLRDRGVDVSKLCDRVYAQLLKKNA